MTPSSRPRTVGQLMTRDPVVATVDMPLADAAAIMDFYRISGLPVCDRMGSLMGVISQTDMLHARATEGYWSAWPGLQVRHLMSGPALTISADAGVDEAAALMERQHVHRLVVTSVDGELPIGVISVSDLVRSMAEWSE
jgi:predicted transcriptional regulator